MPRSHRFALQHLLRDAAHRAPSSLAVVEGERSLTYAELDERSARLARVLAERGVGPGDRVALYLDKSIEAVVGIYAVLRRGAAYVPLDPRSPTPRLAYILRNCDIGCVLTTTAKANNWSGLLAQDAPITALVVLDDPEGDRVVEGPAGVEVVRAGARLLTGDGGADADGTELDLAYILYTSGSTGDPKGVMLSHRNALGFVEWAADEVGAGAEDRFSSHAPFHFDLSVFDLYVAALAGASLHIVSAGVSMFPVEVAKFIDRHQITVWYSVPSILSLLVDRANLAAGALPSLRTVVFAGEVFPSKYLARLMKLLPHAGFLNLYGPTETNVCTYYWVPEPPPEDGEDLPIGRAIAGVDTFVVDEDLAEVPRGGDGELLVRGPTVMRGYWADAAKTEQRLVPDPRPGAAGDPVYRTGDLVSELPSGDYKFLGRRDNQIKTRGYRVELGEIETVLNAHPDVVECAAIAVPDDLVTNRIAAVVVGAPGFEEAGLRRFCSERLPKYMVPETIEVRDALPRTSTGKIDRAGLTALLPEEARP